MSYLSAHRASPISTGDARPEHPLDPARGILLGCVLSAVLWLGIFALVLG